MRGEGGINWCTIKGGIGIYFLSLFARKTRTRTRMKNAPRVQNVFFSKKQFLFLELVENGMQRCQVQLQPLLIQVWGYKTLCWPHGRPCWGYKTNPYEKKNPREKKIRNQRVSSEPNKQRSVQTRRIWRSPFSMQSLPLHVWGYQILCEALGRPC